MEKSPTEAIAHFIAQAHTGTPAAQRVFYGAALEYLKKECGIKGVRGVAFLLPAILADLDANKTLSALRLAGIRVNLLPLLNELINIPPDSEKFGAHGTHDGTCVLCGHVGCIDDSTNRCAAHFA